MEEVFAGGGAGDDGDIVGEGDLVVGDNQPYSVNSSSDYAVPVHGEGRGLVHVELEIRQDLIADAAGQSAWAQRLARILASAAAVPSPC